MLLPELATGSDRTALRFGDAALTYRELAGLAGHLAEGLRGRERVAVWATPTMETCVAVVGALLAGVPVVPVNPKIGERELAHILADSAPDVVLSAPNVELPGPLGDVPRLPVQLAPADAPQPALPAEPDGETPAFVVYTSGTTGPPKGVVLPRRAVATNLDALAEAWEWTGRRRARARAAAVPRARPDPRRRRPAAPRRHAAPPRPVLLRGRRRGAGPRRHDAVRRADHVPPPRRGLRRRRPARRGGRPRAAAGVRLGRAAGHRPRADRHAHRPARGRAVRDDRDPDELQPSARTATAGRARSACRCRASACASSTTPVPRSTSWTARRSGRSRCAGRTCSSAT